MQPKFHVGLQEISGSVIKNDESPFSPSGQWHRVIGLHWSSQWSAVFPQQNQLFYCSTNLFHTSNPFQLQTNHEQNNCGIQHHPVSCPRAHSWEIWKTTTNLKENKDTMSVGTPPYTDSAIGELARKFPRFDFNSENCFRIWHLCRDTKFTTSGWLYTATLVPELDKFVALKKSERDDKRSQEDLKRAEERTIASKNIRNPVKDLKVTLSQHVTFIEYFETIPMTLRVLLDTDRIQYFITFMNLRAAPSTVANRCKDLCLFCDWTLEQEGFLDR